MSLSRSKCWYSNNCLDFLKCDVPFDDYVGFETETFLSKKFRLILAIGLIGTKIGVDLPNLFVSKTMLE